jgi:hypothetical protein
VREGRAGVDSISILGPAPMRASVLGPEFLTLSATRRSIGALGRYSAPRQSSFGEIAGLQLHTSFDRREFGFDWQLEMPDGGEAVGWEVRVDVDLLLIREDS